MFTASAFRKLMYLVISLFGFEGRIWDLIVSVPDHCLSFYFSPRSDAVDQSPHCLHTGISITNKIKIPHK